MNVIYCNSNIKDTVNNGGEEIIKGRKKRSIGNRGIAKVHRIRTSKYYVININTFFIIYWKIINSLVKESRKEE